MLGFYSRGSSTDAHIPSTQVFHHRPEDGSTFAGVRVVVAGGDEAAVDAAMALAEGPQRAAEVLLLHRRDNFQAPEPTLARLRALRDGGRIQVVVGQPTGLDEAGGRLTALHILDADGVTQKLPLDALLVQLGLSPRLGPIAQWGLALERKQLVVDTEKFGTSEPGIFAVGDINTYPGKKKLIVCGFHECVLAAFGAAPVVHPDRPVHLQYTTTSPRLHQLLGVAPG